MQIGRKTIWPAIYVVVLSSCSIDQANLSSAPILKPGKYDYSIKSGLIASLEKFCISEAESEAGLKGFIAKRHGSTCQFDEYRLTSSGQLDAILTCKYFDGEAKIVMTGTVTETGFDIENSETPDPVSGDGTRVSRRSAQRVGPCDS